jgi:hypothetical protein
MDIAFDGIQYKHIKLRLAISSPPRALSTVLLLNAGVENVEFTIAPAGCL